MKAKMARSIASCTLCLLLLAVALPGDVNLRFARAYSTIRKSSTQQQQQQQRRQQQRHILSTELTTPDNGIGSSGSGHRHLITLTNATNTTTTAPTQSPTPAKPTTPTPPPTHEPTKKYESPEDEEKDEERKEGAKVGMIFLWIVVVFAVIWLLVYFRDAIFFFFGNAWSNTRRYGCKGCLRSFFPCFSGSQPSRGSEPLDQIIFETEDPNAPLMT